MARRAQLYPNALGVSSGLPRRAMAANLWANEVEEGMISTKTYLLFCLYVLLNANCASACAPVDVRASARPGEEPTTGPDNPYSSTPRAQSVVAIPYETAAAAHSSGPYAAPGASTPSTPTAR